MTTTLEKRPTRKLRSLFPYWNSPLDNFFRNDFLDLGNGDIAETIPSINITEEKEHYTIEMAAPGLKKEDFNIDVNGNLITIFSEKESEIKNGDGKSGNGNGYSHREYNYSSFSRSFTVPDFADSTRISAKYTDGILNLLIPKKPEAQKNKIQKITVQ